MFPSARISPLLLIALAWTSKIPRAVELAPFKSSIPNSFCQTKARSPELPTTTPESLISMARLDVAPGRIPSSTIPLLLVQSKARLPLGPLEEPTTSPALLIPSASLDESPGNVPRSWTLPLLVQSTACSPSELADTPATSSKSFKSCAVLWLPPGKTLRVRGLLRVQRKALLPPGPEESPTTWPYLLMEMAFPELSPDRSGTRRNPPFSVQMKGRIVIPVFDTPTISPASLIPVAEL